MNILEHYIVEIHSEEELEGGDVKVDFTDSCYGDKRRREGCVYSKEVWESIKARGYYMG